MTRITATVIVLLCFINTIFAQDEALLVQGMSPELYIIHKTAAKENYYSVGRTYNIAPKEIAAYNKLAFESGLNLGQTIKIPLTKNNFIQSQDAGNGNVVIPVYHKVEAKEGLYRVSVNYNKIPLAQLKRWNNLSSDVVSSGTNLIIGYLKVQGESSLVKDMKANKADVASIAKEDQVQEKNTDILKDIVPEKKGTEAAKTSDTETNNTRIVENQANEASGMSVSHVAVNFNGGIFKKLYEDQRLSKTPVTESGLSGVFKSTSGWRDGKYYCFNNNAPAGTILKITNGVNGKSIYAKVLDLIPDINQNAGLILHISNAAAEELGVSSTRFDCSINYAR